MKDLHLLIDDIRNVNEDIVARTPQDGKKMLLGMPVTHLYIDHDLGPDPDGNEYENGYKVVCWAIERGCLPPNVQVVSANPVGRKNIEEAMKQEGYTFHNRYWRK